MAKREIILKAAAGVRLIEVVYRMSQRVFSRYAVTTVRGSRRRDFVALRDARRAFDEEVTASTKLQDGEIVLVVAAHPLTTSAFEAEGRDGQP